ncbi:hypothetical protein HDV00_011008 [Rhizophlyctis rosea]|nr:hypothetical protein HDV00_011008 [Rhizophlyctis rosea]
MSGRGRSKRPITTDIQKATLSTKYPNIHAKLPPSHPDWYCTHCNQSIFQYENHYPNYTFPNLSAPPFQPLSRPRHFIATPGSIRKSHLDSCEVRSEDEPWFENPSATEEAFWSYIHKVDTKTSKSHPTPYKPYQTLFQKCHQFGILPLRILSTPFKPSQQYVNHNASPPSIDITPPPTSTNTISHSPTKVHSIPLTSLDPVLTDLKDGWFIPEEWIDFNIIDGAGTTYDLRLQHSWGNRDYMISGRYFTVRDRSTAELIAVGETVDDGRVRVSVLSAAVLEGWVLREGDVDAAWWEGQGIQVLDAILAIRWAKNAKGTAFNDDPLQQGEDIILQSLLPLQRALLSLTDVDKLRKHMRGYTFGHNHQVEVMIAVLMMVGGIRGWRYASLKTRVEFRARELRMAFGGASRVKVIGGSRLSNLPLEVWEIVAGFDPAGFGVDDSRYG